MRLSSVISVKLALVAVPAEVAVVAVVALPISAAEIFLAAKSPLESLITILPLVFASVALFALSAPARTVLAATPSTKFTLFAVPVKNVAVTVPPPKFKLVPVATPIFGVIRVGVLSITILPVPVWFVVVSGLPPFNTNCVPFAAPIEGSVNVGEVKVLLLNVSVPARVARVPVKGSTTVPPSPAEGPFRIVVPLVFPASTSLPTLPGCPKVLIPVTV